MNSVLMVYRTRGNVPDYVAKLRALNPLKRYKVLVDGKEKGVYSGKVLMEKGLDVHLDDEYRASLVELYLL